MNHVREILKRLERNTAAGAYLSQVFTDWLDITHATLSAIPRHVESVTTTGQLAEDTPASRSYVRPLARPLPAGLGLADLQQSLPHPARKHRRLLEHQCRAGKRPGWDLVGAVYMETAYKKHSGQFFTPWDVAELMARMTIPDGAELVNERLRQARARASAREDLNSHLLAATILAGIVVPEEEQLILLRHPHPPAHRRRLRADHASVTPVSGPA